MNTKLHLLKTDIEAPQLFTYPFNYTPHPLCVMAARQLQKKVASENVLKEDADKGKMFGVLVVMDDKQRLGFLAAYSGLLAARNDWDYFVPSVFDSIQPDGYFKIREKEISDINYEISALQNDEELKHCISVLAEVRQKAKTEIAAYKDFMSLSKRKRDEARASGSDISEEQNTTFIRESQYQKAELRRIKKRCAEDIAAAENDVIDKEREIIRLKKNRKDMSDSLQRWLFSQYDMLNARGERRNLCDIFAETPQGVPPSGAGDCCAPKLLQYAYLNGMVPLCMAEFWWGRSPKTEIRHHLHYYPACRSKCKPILGFMMQGLNVEPNPHDKEQDGTSLKIMYADDSIIVVSKPSGMLSMPGNIKRRCVADSLREEFGNGYYMPAHRLDMDTSGLLVVARSADMLQRLHRQFADRQVRKRYAAVLDGEVKAEKHGFIRLPLSADINDSLRQTVDHNGGKPSVTEYDINRIENGKTYIKLFPHTGRTHQLRVHCAHPEGLGTPILGDSLYGHPSGCCLMLHAEHITFVHPLTGKKMEITDNLIDFGVV